MNDAISIGSSRTIETIRFTALMAVCLGLLLVAAEYLRPRPTLRMYYPLPEAELSAVPPPATTSEPPPPAVEPPAMAVPAPVPSSEPPPSAAEPLPAEPPAVEPPTTAPPATDPGTGEAPLPDAPPSDPVPLEEPREAEPAPIGQPAQEPAEAAAEPEASAPPSRPAIVRGLPEPAREVSPRVAEPRGQVLTRLSAPEVAERPKPAPPTASNAAPEPTRTPDRAPPSGQPEAPQAEASDQQPLEGSTPQTSVPPDGAREPEIRTAARSAPDTSPPSLIRPFPGTTGEAVIITVPIGTVEDGIAAYAEGDFERAERIWRRLARQGLPRAQFHLGGLIYEGRTAPPDPINAYVWLSRAARAGIDRAEPLRERVGNAMTQEQLQEALRRLGG